MSAPGAGPAVRFRRLPGNPDLPLPAYATAGAAGFDLRAAEAAVIPPGGRHLVPTGFAVAVPPGWELQVRPRSGLAVRHGVTVANSPGTVDSDYRGPLLVCLVNLGTEAFARGAGGPDRAGGGRARAAGGSGGGGGAGRDGAGGAGVRVHGGGVSGLDAWLVTPVRRYPTRITSLPKCPAPARAV